MKGIMPVMKVPKDSSTKEAGSTAGAGSCFVSQGGSTMNMKNWTKVFAFTFAMSIALNLAAATEGVPRSRKRNLRLRRRSTLPRS
jgi:preprotein translocase subunit SecG